MKTLIAAAVATSLAGLAGPHGHRSVESTSSSPSVEHAVQDTLDLGNFSVSLTVKDIAKSRAFYEALGFKVKGGDQAQNWLVLQNPTSTIGLFQGMFDKNALTFNPGWDRNGERLEEFADVRELQRRLKAQGIELTTEADEASSGPASFTLVDPDGNPILIDQHVD